MNQKDNQTTHIYWAVASAIMCFASAIWSYLHPNHRPWASLLGFIGMLVGLSILQGGDE